MLTTMDVKRKKAGDVRDLLCLMSRGHRRMAVVLALGKNTRDALRKAKSAASKIKIVEGKI